MVIESLFYLIILATAWPMGHFLAWLCADELIIDRRYFIYLAYFLILIAILFMIFYPNTSMILSLAYIIMVIGFIIPKKTGRKR